jgi:hypothetical protein
MLGISTSNLRVGGFRKSSGNDADAVALYSRIIADGGVSDLTRLNFFIKGLKAIYGSLANVPVCYDAHWIGYKLGSGTGATAGQAAAKLYSLTVAGDAVQTTAASQPLLLSHNGASSDNYWWGSGVNGNFVSTPNAVANQITAKDMIAEIQGDLTTGYKAIIAKADAGGVGMYLLGITSGKFLNYGKNADGVLSTVALPYNNGDRFWIRATYNSGIVTFYYGTNGTSWTQLGTTVSITNSNANLYNFSVEIGSSSAGAGSANLFIGKIYRATISNSIGGTPVVDFNPATYNASTSQTAWTSATGEVWTINTGTATTGYKGVLVDRTIVQADGVDDVISVAISGNAIRTQYFAHKSLGTSTGNINIGGLYLSTVHAQAFYYVSNKYSLYQNGAFEGAFGAVVAGTTNRALRISGAVGGTGTDWIPFQNGVDVSNGGNNIGFGVIYTNLTIFGRGGNTSFDNAIMNTYIQSSTADNLTIRTATQAFAKTLNNNI